MKNSVLVNPLVRIFTTGILCGMLVAPFTGNFMLYADIYVAIVYSIVAVYVMGKKIYDVIWDQKNRF